MRRNRYVDLKNLIFKLIITILNEETIEVGFKNLSGGDIGTEDSENGVYVITIDQGLKNWYKVKVFLHEILHILFDHEIVTEKFVLKFEHILWRLFSKKQKKILKEYMYTLQIKK